MASRTIFSVTVSGRSSVTILLIHSSSSLFTCLVVVGLSIVIVVWGVEIGSHMNYLFLAGTFSPCRSILTLPFLVPLNMGSSGWWLVYESRGMSRR